MTLDAFTGLDASIENFPGLFDSFAPITQNGLEMYDFIITAPPSGGTYDYSVIMFSGGGVYITGDGVTTQFFTSDTRGSQSPYPYAFFMYHRTDQTGFSNPSAITSQELTGTLGKMFFTDPILYSSIDVSFLQTCTENFQASNVSDPQEYYKCSVYNPNCSPVYTASSTCGGGVTPPTAIVGGSCSAVFSEIPSILDNPTGFISGVWNSIGSWFSCLFTSLLDGLTDIYQSGINIISTLFTDFIEVIGLGDWLQSMFVPQTDFLSNQFDELNAVIQTQFSDFYTIYDIAKNAPSTVEDEGLFSGTVTLRGHSSQFNYDPFHDMPIPPIVPNIVSGVAFLSLGWFLIRNLHTIFA